MTSLLTIAQAQALGVGLALSSTDLQTIIDREEAELIRRFGAHYSASPLTKTIEVGHREKTLYLARQISAVTSIVEYLYPGDTASTTLTTTDYIVWGDTGRIVRLPEGMHWGRVITVVYTPVDDSDLRRMVLIELLRIATEQTTSGGGGVAGLGFSVTAGGDATGANWARQREAQYARLGWLSR